MVVVESFPRPLPPTNTRNSPYIYNTYSLILFQAIWRSDQTLREAGGDAAEDLDGDLSMHERKRRLHTIQYEIRRREDGVVSQALGALVTSFAGKLDLHFR